MAQQRAIDPGRDRAALVVSVSCAALALIATVAVELRWRPGRDVVPGIPLPRMGVLLSSETVPEPDPGPVPRPICAHTLGVPWTDSVALESYEELLVDAGWEPRGAEPRAVPTLAYRRDTQRLTVALLPVPGPASRLRVRLRPCA